MKRKVLIIGTIALAALVSVFIYYWHSMRTRNAVELLIQKKKIINILVAGNNVFNDHMHKFFAIVSINPDNNRVGITFIPPAFKIRLDDDGDNCAPIDRTVVYNFNRLRYSLQKDLKLNIPFYLELYGADVERIVDLIEGVNLFVLDQFKDDSSSRMGASYFDGRKVMRYINSVEKNSIYLKYDRILDVLMTMYKEREDLERLNTLEFMQVLMNSIKTNLLPREVMKLGEIIFRDGDVIATVLPGFFKDGYYVMDDITFRIYEKEYITQLIVDRNEKEIDASIKIKILNGTDVPGLARKMRESMIREGLNVVEFGTSPFRKMGKSIIINRRANIAAVNRVAELTGIENVYHVIDNTQLHNIMIIIGEDMAE
ncbi:MAG: LytR C-terminal domain-containing protein [Spirochaetes bacterium]|nr:LytR C-terminal domain-containing protein [Spirochaetota bacterium]